MELEKTPEKTKNIVYVCPVDHSGTSLFVKGWIAPPQTTLSIPLILVHDLEESPDDYVSCAEKLAEAGYNVYTFELRILSKKSKNSGLVELEAFSNDLLQVVSWIKYKEEGRKPVILGQGFGALVCLQFAQDHSKYISAAVFASPLFSTQESISPFKRFLIRSLAQIFPMLATPGYLSFTYSDLIKKESRKRKGRLPISFVQGLLTSISGAHKLFSRLNIPSLILCPETSPVCRYEFLKRLLSKHRNEEKMSLVHLDIEGHQIFNQDDKVLDSVMGILLPWLRVHGHS